MSSRLLRAAKEPLLHFALIGALIYGVYALTGAAEESSAMSADERRVVITAGEVKWLVDSWTARWNRPPTRDEFDGFLRGYVRERVLAQEATLMGLDRDDVVIRRRLAQRLEMFSKDLLTPASADAQVLEQWFEAHKTQYQDPILYTLTQVYLDPDRRGDRVLQDAQAIRDGLNSLDPPPADLNDFGDPFMLPNYYADYSATRLAREFGANFAATVEKLEPGQWQGPVMSGFGVHIVLVSERTTPAEPQFADFEQAVREDWVNATTQSRYEQFETNLIERYDVQVEDSSVILLEPPASSLDASIERPELTER